MSRQYRSPALKLPSSLTVPSDGDALTDLRSYFKRGHSSSGFTGAWFDDFGGLQLAEATKHQLTAQDIVAVSFLSVAVPARAALRLLNEQAGALTSLLERVPHDVDLVDATAEQVGAGSAASELYSVLRAGRDGLGPTLTSKLLARKRPRLLPVWDSYVWNVTGCRKSWWSDLQRALQADEGALHGRLVDLRAAAGLPDHISPLRVLDVLIWREGERRSKARRT